MRRVVIIGTGGIGSNFIKYFLEVIDTFDKKEMVFIKIFDGDIVEEKNIIRSNQNFQIEDIMSNKAEALSKRYKDYGVDFEAVFIDEQNVHEKLAVFDDIIICADNHKVRKILYEYALNKKKWLVDMRAMSTLWAYTIVDGTYNMEHYNETIFKNPQNMEKKGGCQLDVDIQNDNIQNANKTVAFYIANCIYLQHLRGNEIACKEFKTMY